MSENAGSSVNDFRNKHYKDKHLEQLSRTLWPDDPDNVIFKTSCAKFVFRGQVRKHCVYSRFLQFESLEKIRFGHQKQLASLKRTIFEVAAAKSYRPFLVTRLWEKQSQHRRGSFLKTLVLQTFQEKLRIRASDAKSRITTSKFFCLESAML